ncbi:MAG TPA: IS4 family transposase [Flavobacterium sp.]|nr:IS4 family transposase [Flavobacterium sp.]
MSKSTFFTGQPIFNQIIRLFSVDQINKLSRKYASDRYCKKFKTYDHLIVMLYTIFNRCTSIREVVTGLLACHTKLQHLGIHYSVRKSTLSDANQRRDYRVFEAIYGHLHKTYASSLPDSRSKKWINRLYIMDSTTISLFQEILKNAGPTPMNGKRKGGIKAHTLIKADQDVAQLVCMTAGATNDTVFMKQIDLPAGSILTFDRGYNDYTRLDYWTRKGVSWVTRLRQLSALEIVAENPISENQAGHGVLKDVNVIMGHPHKRITKVHARLITYYDSKQQRTFQFLTNNMKLSALTIAEIYRHRWQIEVLFKRIKQNYPLRNFLGDNENAIRIQIWCALIADLLLKIIQKQVKRVWSFANLSSMIRLHLMTYINLWGFLNKPEKMLLGLVPVQSKQPLLFKT